MCPAFSAADAAPNADLKVERCSTFCSVRMGNLPPLPADFSGPFNSIGLCAWSCKDGKVGAAAVNQQLTILAGLLCASAFAFCGTATPLSCVPGAARMARWVLLLLLLPLLLSSSCQI
jgi:hypothetical protein